MNRTAQTVLRALPAAHEFLDTMADERARREESFRTQTAELAAELGCTQLVTATAGFDTRYVKGYVPNGYYDDPLPGFRLDTKNPNWRLPAKKTEEGKAMAKRLNAIRFVEPRDPGLPDIISGVGFFGAFRVSKLGEHYYATVNFECKKKELDKEVDTLRWEQIPLSEYYRALEDSEAAAAA